MAVTFNGSALTITFAPGAGGLQTIDAQIDLYQEWKDWLLADPTRRGFPFAFRSTGGDLVSPGLKSGSYFFIRNDFGWRLKFPESDEEVTLTGSLAPEDPALPVVVGATGAFKSALFGLQPITQNVDLLLNDIQFVRQIIAGRAVVSLDDLTVTIYETDLVTVLQTFSISADGRVRLPT